MFCVMPRGLHRTYGAHHRHFITCWCYRRLPFLSTACSRDRFISILEQTRERYRLVVVVYVVMPGYIHLLITEPEIGTPSTVMQVLKQRSARVLLQKKKRAAPAVPVSRREPAHAFLAGALLRFQRVDDKEACGEAEVYASQSGEAGLGGRAGGMALEQLSFLSPGQSLARASE
ncbi:MAG: transposase [Candidatus Sulfotelmatobacter sp.]